MAELKDLLGKTMVGVENVDGQQLVFTTTEAKRYLLYHGGSHSRVSIEDIAGDLADLVGEPMLLAEESTGDRHPPGVTKDTAWCFLWTFYKFATRKGYIDVRWYGEGGANYSQCVDFDEDCDAIL